MSEHHRRTLTLEEPLGDNIAPPIGQFIEDHRAKIVGQVELAPAGARTVLSLTLNCELAEANALEQYLRDRFQARGVRLLGTGPLTTIRYGGESPELFFRSMSRALVHKHGPLRSLNYANHFPNFEIWLAYSDGARVYSGRRTGAYDIHFLALGYVGEGPRHARVFLEEAGFSMSAEEIDAIRPGAMIELRDGKPIVSYPDNKTVAKPETQSDVSLEDDLTLHKAIIQEDPTIIRALIARGDDIHAVDKDGATPLHYAACIANPDIAKTLLERGARVDAKNAKGQTPLYEVAGHLHRDGDEATMGVLLAAGASLGARDNDGATPLHAAAIGGHYQAAKLLLDKGADLQALAQQLTPLHFSAYAGNPEVTQLLIERGADVFAEKDGLNPLHMARQPGHSTEAGKEAVIRMLERAMARGNRAQPTRSATEMTGPLRGDVRTTATPAKDGPVGAEKKWWQFWK